MRKKIYLISPREPSGATWLINCFLALGVKTYRVSEQQMWRKSGNEYYLTEQENILKQWLPALTARNSFQFREDIEIQWTHDWPQEKFKGHKIIFFTRDPRDSLYSRYRREQPDFSYSEFVDFLDTQTLLNKIDNWILFHEAWMRHQDLKVFHFEDYKENPFRTLFAVLEWLDLSVPDRAIDEALEMSTSEKAIEAERQYMQTQTAKQVINQGGIVGRWKMHLEDTSKVNTILDERCTPTIAALGYCTESAMDSKKFLRSIGFNLTHGSLLIEVQKVINENLSDDYTHYSLEKIIHFIDYLNKEKLAAGKIQNYEIDLYWKKFLEIFEAMPFDTQLYQSKLQQLFGK